MSLRLTSHEEIDRFLRCDRAAEVIILTLQADKGGFTCTILLGGKEPDYPRRNDLDYVWRNVTVWRGGVVVKEWDELIYNPATNQVRFAGKNRQTGLMTVGSLELSDAQ